MKMPDTKKTNSERVRIVVCVVGAILVCSGLLAYIVFSVHSLLNPEEGGHSLLHPEESPSNKVYAYRTAMHEYVDPDTGVHYWVQEDVGMTPRLNPDGTIMVTSQN